MFKILGKLETQEDCSDLLHELNREEAVHRLSLC